MSANAIRPRATRAFLKLLCAGAAALAPCAAQAYYYCDGAITELGIYPDGRVIIYTGFVNEQIVCNISSDVTLPAPNNTVTITAATCKAWYSSFLAARLANKNVQIVVNDTTCTGLVDSYGNLTKPLVNYRFLP